VRACVRELTMW